MVQDCGDDLAIVADVILSLVTERDTKVKEFQNMRLQDLQDSVRSKGLKTGRRKAQLADSLAAHMCRGPSSMFSSVGLPRLLELHWRLETNKQTSRTS